jgi:MinD superfamily P-loop ATPase
VIISVASGKGGTGKTLVATSLTLSLKEEYDVQLLDCDVEEPNVDEKKCTYCGRCAEVCAYNAIAVVKDRVLVFPELCHGCGACSYLCPEKAITEMGKEIGVVESGNSDGMDFVQGRLTIGQPMAPPVIRKVKEQAHPNGVVVIDASPGTSCPVVEAIKHSDFCLLVTEPTPFGLNDMVLAVETVRRLNIPCGVVLNRTGVGDKGTEEYCRRESIPILMTIPLDTRIARIYSQGIPLVEGMANFKDDFLNLFDKIGEIVNERSSCIKR